MSAAALGADLLPVSGGGLLRGSFRPPGDKSLTHRSFLLAALAEGESVIRRANDGDDCRRLLAALAALGVAVRGEPPGPVEIAGRGAAAFLTPDRPLDLGNSGTALRLLAGALAGGPARATLTGDDSLRARPMLRVVEPLRKMGAKIEGREEGRFAPITITGAALEGRRLTGIRYLAPVPSAQVKSAILLAGLGADGTTSIVEPIASRDHTERLMKAMGAQVAYCDGSVRLTPGKTLQPIDWEVPADPSGAAFFLAAACAIPGSEVAADGVSLNATRTGFVRILRRMGASVVEEEAGAAWREPAGRIAARGGELSGTVVPAEEIPACVDEVPILAAVAAVASGETRFEGVGELRVKESNRIDAIVEGLRAFGAEAESEGETLVVRGGPAARLRPARVASRGDHRIAMAFACLALLVPGETVIEGASMIETSYPRFASELGALRATS